MVQPLVSKTACTADEPIEVGLGIITSVVNNAAHIGLHRITVGSVDAHISLSSRHDTSWAATKAISAESTGTGGAGANTCPNACLTILKALITCNTSCTCSTSAGIAHRSTPSTSATGGSAGLLAKPDGSHQSASNPSWAQELPGSLILILRPTSELHAKNGLHWGN